MSRQASSLLPISPGVLIGILVACGVVVSLLIPSERDLLERQIRDGYTSRALATIRRLSAEERARKPAYYAWLELKLERQLIQPLDYSMVQRQIVLTCQAYVRYQFQPQFLNEIVALIDLIPAAETGRRAILPFLDAMPFPSQQALAHRLATKALAANEPATAARIFGEFSKQSTPLESTTIESVRLWRLAGSPPAALEAIEALARNCPRNLEQDYPKVARLRIVLLREMSRTAQAFEATRDLFHYSDPAGQRALFDLLTTTALEANRAKDILAPVKARAQSEPGQAKLTQLWAEAALAAGDQRSAIQAYERLADLHPQDGEIQIKLAQLHEWTGQPNKAFDFYLSVLTFKPEAAVDRLFELNAGLYRDLELVDALSACKAVRTNETRFLSMARLLTKTGNFQEAMEYYEMLVNKAQDRFDILSEYGRLLQDLFEFGKAREVFLKAEALRPKDTGIRMAIAEMDYRLEHYEEALKRYRSLAEEGFNLDAIGKHLQLAESLGRLDEAAYGLRRKLNLSIDKSAEDHVRLAHYQVLLGAASEAIGTLQEGIVHFPENAELRVETAFALAKAGQLVPAARALEGLQGLKIKLEWAQLYLSLLVQSQDYLQARKFLASGLAPDMLNHPSIAEIQAQVYEANRQHAAALIQYQQLHIADPRNPRHGMNYARMLNTQGRFKEAEKVVHGYLEGTDPEIMKLAAQVFSAAGNHKAALHFQRRYLASSPPDVPQAWGFLGDILLSQGDKTNAKRAYKRSVSELIFEVNPRQRP